MNQYFQNSVRKLFPIWKSTSKQNQCQVKQIYIHGQSEKKYISSVPFIRKLLEKEFHQNSGARKEKNT